jgi:predicted ABC-type ATPase
MFFLVVETVDVALSRIKDRVRKGGHDVPDRVVRRPFKRSIVNFFGEYENLANSWYLFDNTTAKPEAVAFKKGLGFL